MLTQNIPRKNIGIDLDSTLNALDLAWSQWVQATHDPEFNLDRWISWDVHEHTTAGLKIYDFLDLPGTFDSLPVKAGALRVTSRLAEFHNLFVISHITNYRTCPDKVAWLRREMPHIPVENIFFCTKKFMVDVDVLIDDGAHNFRDFTKIPLLLDAPWNRANTELDSVEVDGLKAGRVKNWDAIEAWMEANGWLPPKNRRNFLCTRD